MQLMGKFDKNHDGSISTQEMYNMLTRAQAHRTKMMNVRPGIAVLLSEMMNVRPV